MRMTGPGESTYRTSWLIWGAVAVVVLMRLPLLGLPAWADEAGYLTVGGGWHLGGSAGRSLYDAYWVDRPPVLITLYGAADRLGGLVALRLLGAVAAAVSVWSVGWAARAVAGPRAGVWAALTGAALLSSSFHWSFMVDGELLAAPFVAAGLGCVVSGIAAAGRRGLVLSASAGALAVAAMLTKQNIADVFIFMAAVVVIGLLLRTISLGQAARHVGAFTIGALACAVAVAGWTKAHGTSLGSVYYAMYPFRLDAAKASTGGGTNAIAWSRLLDMGLAALLSGLLLLIGWLTVSGVRRRIRDAYVLALLVVLVFDLFSVAAGTNYWLHYLLQPAVPVAVLTGIVVARDSWTRFLSLGAVVTALIGWVVLVLSPPQTGEELVGQAIGGVAHPGDTILTLPGRSNISYASGLPSPYPYLWALPARTLDPGGSQLKKLLSGPFAPTWVVTNRRTGRRPRPGSVSASIANHYRPVTRVCGETIYLHIPIDRAPPKAHPRSDATKASRCQSVTALPHVLREIS